MTFNRLTQFTLPILALFFSTLLGLPYLFSLATAVTATVTYDCAVQSDISQAECEALVAIYDANPGGNFGSGWLEDGVYPCSWNRVTCGEGDVTGLGLNFAQLSAVPGEIGYLTNLVILHLGNNQLTAVPAQIGNLINLEVLTLSYNQLTAVPAEIGSLASLRTLYLDNNSLSSLPPEIGDLATLIWLDLTRNQLTDLPVEIGNLSALTGLNLRNNQLSSLPAGISSLTTLTSLDISYNELSSLPPEIGNLTGLTGLVLYYNRLSSLPPEIGSLTNLRSLFLAGNQLSSLPPQIGNLSSLRDLDLAGNQLSSIPPAIGNLDFSLRWLFLENNRLTSLPPEIGNLYHLSTLNLAGNQLSNLPTAMATLNVNALNLAENQLTSLPPQIVTLTSLDLAGNQINSLEGISNLPGLVWLYLSGNQLSELPAEIDNLTNLRMLDLHNNPLTGPLPEALLLLNLAWFYFYNTDWCIPDEVEYHNWLASISTVAGTGRLCGQPGGGISGQVTLNNTAPASQVAVVLYRAIGLRRDELVTTTHTDTGGNYHFDELGQGINYFVYYRPSDDIAIPQYYDGQATLFSATPLMITLGITTTNVNAVLTSPQPPLATITTASGSVTTNPVDGTIVVAQRNGNPSDITVTRSVLCGDNSVPDTVTLTLAGHEYPMLATGAPNEYRVTIPAGEVTGGTLIVIAACNGSNETTIIGSVTLYDPSGYISDDQSGEPVVGAMVTLYQVPHWRARKSPTDTAVNTCQSNLSKAPNEPWNQPAPTGLGLRVNLDTTIVDPPTSRQTTDNEGYYGWEVPAGCWYVTVQADGYEPLTSPIVGVPTAVTDLNLTLTPSISVMNNHIYLPTVIR